MRTGILLLFSLLCACRCGHKIYDPPHIAVTTSGGRITITGQIGSSPPIVIRDAEVRVGIDGQLLTSAGQPCTSTESVLMDCSLANGLKLSVVLDGNELTASVSGTGTHVVNGFQLLSTTGSDEGIFPSSGTTQSLRYLHNGYQSWSYSGSLDVPLGLALPRTNGVVNYPAPDGTPSVDETLGLSSHSAVISGGDGTAMVLGFVSANLWQGAIALDSPNRQFDVTAQCGFTGDTVPLGSSPVSSETLFIDYELSPTAAMTSYGNMLMSLKHTRPVPPATGQRGWFSWNENFANITEPIVDTQATAMAPLLGTDGFKLIEIDDGWENAWGDWTANSKFDPVSTLASTRHAAGQTLGLWVAPFVAEQTQPIVTQHPDWWVQNGMGQPIVNTGGGSSHTLVIVDTTQPEALAWAVGNLAALQQQGVDFFKLDYLYLAALDGTRSNPNATGVAALTFGLQAIFNAIGPAAINLCGVPWLHAALAPTSTIRTGSDVAYNIGAAGFALVGMAVRDMSARNFGFLALESDPDQFPLNVLTEQEQRTALAIQVIAGPTFAFADDLTTLSPSEQSLLVQAAQLPPGNENSIVESRGIFDSAATAVVPAIVEVLNGPDVVSTALPSVLVRDNLLAATNWSSSTATVSLQLNPGEVVTPIWGPAASGGSVQLDAHDTALYQLNRPIQDE